MAFFFGVLPDILSFGIYIVGSWIGIFKHPNFSSGRHPDPSMIPDFVHIAYDWTHSLVIFLVVFGIVWIVRQKIYWPMFAWPLHILSDIPTHSGDFFPTPFLWPLSDFHVYGVSWGHPYIFFPNWILLLTCLYALFLHQRLKNRFIPRQKAKNAL